MPHELERSGPPLGEPGGLDAGHFTLLSMLGYSSRSEIDGDDDARSTSRMLDTAATAGLISKRMPFHLHRQRGASMPDMNNAMTTSSNDVEGGRTCRSRTYRRKRDQEERRDRRGPRLRAAFSMRQSISAVRLTRAITTNAIPGSRAGQPRIVPLIPIAYPL